MRGQWRCYYIGKTRIRHLSGKKMKVMVRYTILRFQSSRSGYTYLSSHFLSLVWELFFMGTYSCTVSSPVSTYSAVHPNNNLAFFSPNTSWWTHGRGNILYLHILLYMADGMLINIIHMLSSATLCHKKLF